MDPRAATAAAGLILTLLHGACAARAPVAAAELTVSEASLAGPWILTLSQEDGTELAVRMAFEATGPGRFAAYSRSGAAGELVGHLRAFAGRLLGRLPPRGALVNLRDGVAHAEGDTLRVTGTLSTMFFGDYRLRGTLREGRLRGVLQREGDGRVRWEVSGEPQRVSGALRDYPALAERIEADFRSRIYDPALLEQPRFRTFLRELERRMARARDDLDAMAAFLALSRRLGISHVGLVRNPVMAAMPLDTLYAGALPPGQVILSFPAPGVALLRVDRWSRVTPQVRRAFERIDSAGAQTLLLDIRWNPGGDVSSMAPVAHLFAEPLTVGVFLGQRWYARRRTPPTPEEMERLPVLDDDSVIRLIETVLTHGAAVGRVPPVSPHFRGEVYVLTGTQTASASEPLAHLLRTTGRGTLVGRRTAGAMLSAPPRGTLDGWVLIVPEADYYAADGTRLEGVGVPPHVDVPEDRALLAVAARLREREPLAAALVEGAGHLEGRRWAEAEAAYTEAARLRPESARAWWGLGRAHQERQQWEQAFAAFERALSHDPDDLGALYQLGRSAALSGQQLAAGEAALREYLRRPHQLGEPAQAAAHWRLGMILEAGGRLDEARQEYRRAFELDPASAEYAAALRRLDSP